MKARVAWNLASIAVVVAIIMLWQMVADTKILSPAFFPGPDRTWKALTRAAISGDLAPRIYATVWRMLIGWMLASVLGILLGSLIGSSERLRRFLGPTLEFLRPLPASATIPVFIVLLGLSDAMVLSVVAFGALWPMLLGTVHGFQAVEPRLYEVARVLHLSRLAVIFKIALPSAMPDILSGLRLSLTVALILTVVCEMLIGVDGLGSWTLISARAFRSADLYAGVLLLGLIGYLGATALAVLSRRLLVWKHGSR
ncbi:MAG TPA: ABC transporter permease [Xanthobacteraceae bacterium]|jgi:sulfonate transport system permease protein|nr:ABC transporter permease [Xanthobacteraceae bacterium]